MTIAHRHSRARGNQEGERLQSLNPYNPSNPGSDNNPHVIPSVVRNLRPLRANVRGRSERSETQGMHGEGMGSSGGGGSKHPPSPLTQAKGERASFNPSNPYNPGSDSRAATSRQS